MTRITQPYILLLHWERLKLLRCWLRRIRSFIIFGVVNGNTSNPLGRSVPSRRNGQMPFGETKTFNDLDEREFLNLFQAIIEADIYGKYIISRLHCFPSISVKLVIFSINRIRRFLHLMARKPSDVYHKNQLNMFQKFAHSIFDAAERGNVEFLSILIRSYPDIIWMSDDNSLSLLHVAALNRHVSIFKMIYKYGGIKNLIASYNNKNTEDNMLHLVARLPPPNRLQAVSGAALQMQRELRWFNAVKEIVPQSFINTGNKKNS
ncbi:unnamed protein product [Brassica napus]|uniref:(rape) hypothetical protein n=1 Tax=Brassica napus TaxID=3708 RepID=A0A816W9E1_BRANA|nr:unnamed protein product [Brassica napus]